MSYKNQTIIKLDHLDDIVYHKKESTETWLKPLKWEPIKEAMRLLNGNGFKLWLYLFSWGGKGIYEFSPAGLLKELQMSDEGARQAKNELINKGYLVPNSTEGQLEFYPISRTSISKKEL